MAFALDHIVLNVRDIDASIAFYSGLIGLGVERLEEYKRGELPFPSLRVNAETIVDLLPEELWASSTEVQAGENMNHFCIAVSLADWERIESGLDAAGVSIEAGPMILSGARGDGNAVYVRDPDGNRVEIRYYD